MRNPHSDANRRDTPDKIVMIREIGRIAMAVSIRQLHDIFVGEVSGVDISKPLSRDEVAAIEAGMDRYAVLVFREQPFTDEEQVAFARRLDGALHTKTGASALYKSRLGTEALADISNVDEAGELLKSDDRRRA
jgi:alpha-ketoglutarate-dependent 2,4-dichlorophenoxyacetate dioxygenase